MRWPIRYSKVPWLGPQDLEPMGPPESRVDGGDEVELGLYVPSPFGNGTDCMLRIRAEMSTTTVTASLSHDFTEQEEKARAVITNLQSGPRRHKSEDEED